MFTETQMIELLTRKDISPSARIACYLVKCQPQSIKELSKTMGISYRYTRYLIAELREAGLLQQFPQKLLKVQENYQIPTKNSEIQSNQHTKVEPLKNRNGYVYFIQAIDFRNKPIKIGWSSQVKQRLKNMTWIVKSRLKSRIKLLALVEGKINLEHDMHVKFKHLNIYGEWFSPNPEIIDFVKSILNKIETFSLN